jgi:hypothetical protein
VDSQDQAQELVKPIICLSLQVAIKLWEKRGWTLHDNHDNGRRRIQKVARCIYRYIAPPFEPNTAALPSVT